VLNFSAFINKKHRDYDLKCGSSFAYIKKKNHYSFCPTIGAELYLKSYNYHSKLKIKPNALLTYQELKLKSFFKSDSFDLNEVTLGLNLNIQSDKKTDNIFTYGISIKLC
jgi:hypothetical protein